MYAYLCHNPDCADHENERLFDFDGYVAELKEAKQQADAEGSNFDDEPHVFCGTCGTAIDDDGHEVPDNYVPQVKGS